MDSKLSRLIWKVELIPRLPLPEKSARLIVTSRFTGGRVPNRDLIVIGASAGGIEALRQLCAGLPADLNAAVLVVLHTAPNAGGLLPRVLTRAGPLLAAHPLDGDEIQKGRIYVAPPDLHMIVEDGVLRTIQGPRENHHRPAIDPTFRSAALSRGNRVIGVVLTGLLDDGTSGLMVVRAHGGTAVVQDPSTAMFPSMPQHALDRVPDALVASTAELPQLLSGLVTEKIEADEHTSASKDPLATSETRFAELDMSEIEKEIRNGKPSSFACPECGGVLWEINQQGMLRFRCRVGHAYTAEHLRAEQRHAVETALWSALRALEESAALYKRMAERARAAHQSQTRRVYDERASTAESNARTLRDFLVNVNVSESPTSSVPASEHHRAPDLASD